MSHTDEQAITRIFEVELPSFVRAGEESGYVSLWAEDCMWCPPDRPDQTGKVQIEQAVRGLFEEFTIEPASEADEVKVVDRYGFINGTGCERVTPVTGGPTVTYHSREFWLFVKLDDSWKIARIIFNNKPSPPAGT